jgi:GT2 family glycosyltransferase
MWSAENPRVGGVNPAVCDVNERDELGYGMCFGGFDLSSKWLHDRPAAPCAVPMLLWACGAMRRTVFDETGGFDEGMIRCGSIDNEMSVRLWLEGYELWTVPSVTIARLFRKGMTIDQPSTRRIRYTRSSSACGFRTSRPITGSAVRLGIRRSPGDCGCSRCT